MIQNNLNSILKLNVLFILLFASLTMIYAVDCPFGIINDTAPGVCTRYIDGNSDGYCDLSEQTIFETTYQAQVQIAPVEIPELTGKELKQMTVEQTAEFYKIDKKYFLQHISDYYKIPIAYTDTFLLLHDNYGVEPDIVKGFAEEILLHHGPIIDNNSNEIIKEKTIELTNTPLINTNQSNNETKKPRYVLISIIIISTLLYITTYTLSKYNIISSVNHKKIWNIGLTISFIASGVLGLLLVIRINYGILVYLPFNMLYWHVEFGIVMAIISIFHIIWHLNYYKTILSFNKKKKK